MVCILNANGIWGKVIVNEYVPHSAARSGKQFRNPLEIEYGLQRAERVEEWSSEWPKKESKHAGPPEQIQDDP